LRKNLKSRVDALVGPGRLPGATFAVALPDGAVIRVAGGLADIETSEPLPETARMFSGSIGKLFVASIVLGLEADGALELGDPVLAHLNDEPWFSRVPNAGAMTIRHLLSHTSGVPDHTTKPEFWAAVKAEPDRAWTAGDRVRFVLDDAPVCAPGELFHYADTNYILLGAVVERLVGRSWYEEARERLLRPCGLGDTAPAVGRRHAGLPSGYGERLAELGLAGKVAEGGLYFSDPAVEGAGGGLVTTSADLARFARCLFGGRLLGAESVARMTCRTPLETGLSDGAGYGLGAIVWDTPLGEAFGHSGFVPGFNSLVEYYPARDLAIALQTNTDAATAKLGRTLHEAALEIAWEIAG